MSSCLLFVPFGLLGLLCLRIVCYAMEFDTQYQLKFSIILFMILRLLIGQCLSDQCGLNGPLPFSDWCSRVVCKSYNNQCTYLVQLASKQISAEWFVKSQQNQGIYFVQLASECYCVPLCQFSVVKTGYLICFEYTHGNLSLECQLGFRPGCIVVQFCSTIQSRVTSSLPQILKEVEEV